MRQVWISKAGPPEVLQVREGPSPAPGPGQVRVAVEAIGVNFADIMGRLGIYPDAPRLPYVPGYEVSGRVDVVGPGVDSVQPGQDVIAAMAFGGYSDTLCISANQLFLRPANMTAEQGAGFLVPYLTAYAALVALAGIKPGEHVLVQTAAGGLGLAAVDICRVFDATIYGTASPGKHGFLRERGVHHPIDYRHLDFEREVKRLTGGRGVQIALDSIGGRSWLKSYRTLSPMGRLVICGVSAMAPGLRRSLRGLTRFALGVPWFHFNPVSLANANKGVMGVNMGHLLDQQDMLFRWGQQLLAWYEQGKLRVHVDRVFPLEDAAEAHRYIQARSNTGKVILRT